MTYGWVREDDLEAFYEGTERFPDPGPPSGPTYKCPFCAAIYSVRLELQNHVSDGHKVERAAIIIKGAEPSRRATVRSKLTGADVVIVNTTSATIGINGGNTCNLSLDDLIKTLVTTPVGEARITLLNEVQKNATPVITTYDFSLCVAGPNELRAVEYAFADIIMSDQISREAIGRFLEDARATGPASEYAVGLAEYTLGVLLKERPDTEPLTTPFSRYREAYGAALQKLSDFDRPLARIVANIIRFAMNDLSGSVERTGIWELDLARFLLNDPSSDDFSIFRDLKEARKPICPIDHGTGQILAMAERMSSQERWGPILDEECRKVAVSEILDATDRQKALAIWAASAWRLSAKESAIEPLRQIAATYPFSNWAEPYLESVTK